MTEADRDSDEAAALDAQTPLLRAPEVPEDPRYLYRQNVTILICASIFLVQLSIGIMTPAWNAIMEDLICQRYVPRAADGQLLADDPRCKAPQIQGELAMLRGWQMTFECVPAILCAIPFGIMADKIGRKPVVIIAWTGLLLNILWYDVVFALHNILPLWTVWLGGLFLFIGGFPSVAPAMMYTYLADVTPQPERASAFFRLNAALLLASLICGPLSGWLLMYNPWLPLLVGAGIQLLSTLILFVLPETLHLAKKVDDEQDSQSEDEDGELHLPTGLWQAIVQSVKINFGEIGTFIIGNGTIIILMIPLVFDVVGKYVQELLLQYVTKRYHWTWSQAAFLVSIKSCSTLLLFLVVLPGISWLMLEKLHVEAVRKDLTLARISGFILIVGSLLIAFAWTPKIIAFAMVVFSLGGGFSPLIRSLLNAHIEVHHIAILNSLVGILEYGGLMVSSPVLSAALRTGFNLGGAWVGLPFMIAALFFVVSTTIVCVFRLPARQADHGDGETAGTASDEEQEARDE